MSQCEDVLPEHEGLSPKPQHPHKKPGMAAHMPVASVLKGRRIETEALWGLLAIRLAPGSVKHPVSKE